jgi:hypothetical protein
MPHQSSVLSASKNPYRRTGCRPGLGPVWSGPSVSRGRVYVGTGNTLFIPMDFEAYFPKKFTGVLYSFGLPGEDEVSRMTGGRE